MAAILNSAMDSAILVFPLTHSHFSHHLHKKNFTHSFWLNLMMAAILNSANSDTAILDSDTLLSSLRFTQKHSHSTLTLTQTNSIWLKLIHSHSTWWWQPSWILPSWIQHCHLGFSHLSFSLKLTHTCQDWFPPFDSKKLILHSFILTQLDDGSHLEFCHLGFSHFDSNTLVIFSQFTHSFILNLMMAAILNSAILNSAILIQPS